MAGKRQKMAKKGLGDYMINTQLTMQCMKRKNKFTQFKKINIELVFYSVLLSKIRDYNTCSDVDLMFICMNYAVITKKSFNREK